MEKHKIKKIFSLLLFVFFPIPLFVFCQDLFDSVLQETNLNYELYGYVQAGTYFGPIAKGNGCETKSTCGESSLKLRLRKGVIGDVFAEIRIRQDMDENDSKSKIILREGCVNAHLGSFDVCIGQQIVVRGKADGFKPTNVITPFNLLSFTPDEDDRRTGNFLIRSFWNHSWNHSAIRIETIWVPVYKPSVLPFQKAMLPKGMQLIEPDYPDENIANSALAFKFNYFGPSLDGSISYSSGYIPIPGLSASVSENTVRISPAAYRAQAVGADFSTTIGRYGLRGELAYKKTNKEETRWQSVPRSEIEYVMGVDREFSHFSLIAQYIGKYVFDLTKLKNFDSTTQDFIIYKMGLWNRMLSSQLKEWQSSISLRTSWKLLHEKLDTEFSGLFNLSTEEIFLKPKITYELSDNLDLTIGGQIFLGPDNTLYGKIDESISAGFLEFKACF